MYNRKIVMRQNNQSKQTSTEYLPAMISRRFHPDNSINAFDTIQQRNTTQYSTLHYITVNYSAVQAYSGNIEYDT
jgi:hypothetical protein